MLKVKPLVFEDKEYQSYVDNVYLSSLCSIDKEATRQKLLQLRGEEEEENIPEQGVRIPIQERILAAKGLISSTLRPGSAPAGRRSNSRSCGRVTSAKSCLEDGTVTESRKSSAYRFRKGRPGSCCGK